MVVVCEFNIITRVIMLLGVILFLYWFVNHYPCGEVV
jgi:hypothetical protein